MAVDNITVNFTKGNASFSVGGVFVLSKLFMAKRERHTWMHIRAREYISTLILKF